MYLWPNEVCLGTNVKIAQTSSVNAIAFEDAVRIFEGPTLEKVDDRFDYDEVRIYAIGIVNGIEITLIYTDVSEDERRIISAWRAEHYERKAYWQSLG